MVSSIRKSLSLLLIDCTFSQAAHRKEFLLSLEMCAECSLSWGLYMKGTLVKFCFLWPPVTQTDRTPLFQHS